MFSKTAKTRWRHLTPEEQKTYGDGCGTLAIGLKVPDFIFEASCRQHDFYYERGGWPWHKVEADFYFWWYMVKDSLRKEFFLEKFIYSFLATVYFLAVSIVSWPFFTMGRWRTKEEILERDRIRKEKLND